MRGLRFLYAATAASVVGDGMLVSATPLAAAAVSREAADVGFVAAAATAAWLLLGIPAGALVDRWDLRRTMIAADLFRGAVLAVLGLLFVLGRASIPVLAGAVFLVGVATCFFTPAGVALLRATAGSERSTLTTANGRFWSIDAVGRSLAGPPLGAWAFGVSRAVPFLADALSFLVSAVFLWFVPPPVPQHRRGGLGMAEGVRFLAADRVMRGLAMSAFAFNLAYFTVFAPFVLYAQDRIGVGVLGFGLLLACGAAGGVAAGLLAQRIIGDRPALSVYASVFLFQGAAWLSVWLMPVPAVAAVALAVVGAAAGIATVAGQATRQLATPARLLGRVASVHRIASSGGGTIGALVGGVLASWRDGAPFAVAVALMVPCAALAFRAGRNAGPDRRRNAEPLDQSEPGAAITAPESH